MGRVQGRGTARRGGTIIVKSGVLDQSLPAIWCQPHSSKTVFSPQCTRAVKIVFNPYVQWCTVNRTRFPRVHMWTFTWTFKISHFVYVITKIAHFEINHMDLKQRETLSHNTLIFRDCPFMKKKILKKTVKNGSLWNFTSTKQYRLLAFRPTHLHTPPKKMPPKIFFREKSAKNWSISTIKMEIFIVEISSQKCLPKNVMVNGNTLTKFPFKIPSKPSPICLLKKHTKNIFDCRLCIPCSSKVSFRVQKKVAKNVRV